MRIPAGLREKASWGPKVREWLEALPGLCADLSDRWSVRLGEPFANCQVSLVVPADGAEIPAVIKIPLPAEIEIGTVAGDYRDREAAALRAWAATGRPSS